MGLELSRCQKDKITFEKFGVFVIKLKFKLFIHT